MTDEIRTCADCHQGFTVTVSEQRYLRGLADELGGAWHLPTRCLACRQARRREMTRVSPDTPDGSYELTCVDCGARFAFGTRDVAYYRARGFAWPRRCRPCRAVRRPPSSSGRPAGQRKGSGA